MTSRTRWVTAWLIAAGAVSAWPRTALAQGTACNFPQAWANAVSWTGSFSMTAKGSGAIPPDGSYSITQTVTGTVSLDHLSPLSNSFFGKATFTYSAHEHYEIPEPPGPPLVIDFMADGKIDASDRQDVALLAFDFANCKYYLSVEPNTVAGTFLGNPANYTFGPLDLETPKPNPAAPDFTPIPTAGLPDLIEHAQFDAITTFQFGYSALTKPVSWEVIYNLTPKICEPLTVPLLKQTADPWRHDTYDKFFESGQVLLPRSTAVSPKNTVELLVFPIGTSQGTPIGAAKLDFSLAAGDNNLYGLTKYIVPTSTDSTSSTLMAPDKYHLGSRLSLTRGGNLLRQIADFGCFLTSATMILDFYAGSVVANPRDVNDWLNDQPDGFHGHEVNPNQVAGYAAAKHGVTMAFKGRFDKPDDAEVERYICSRNPVMLKVSPCFNQNEETCPHFVVATGKTVSDGQLTWAINDPALDSHDLGPYQMVYFGYRLFTGPSGGPSSGPRAPFASAAAPDQSRLIVSATSPAFQLTVSDPTGRQSKCGAFGIATARTEIPDATCGTDSIQNDSNLNQQDTTPPVRIFEASTPASGSYEVDVLTMESGDFSVNVFAYDSDGGLSAAKAAGTATGGGTTRYSVSYSAAPGMPVRLIGPGGAGGSAAADGGPGTGSQPSAAGGSENGGCSSSGSACGGLLALMAVAVRVRRRARPSSSASL